MSSKKIAVFIPCYNASSTIVETLRSVQESIMESGMEIPVFIYDDCSKDDSYAKVVTFSKQAVNFNAIKNQANAGERKTTNAAFSHFLNQFDWACIIHADDIAKKEWITVLRKYISEVNDENCFSIWSSFDAFFHDSGKINMGDNSGVVRHGKREMAEIRDLITKVSSSWHLSGAAINVMLYNKLNGFDESMPQFGDTDFFVKGLLAGYTDVYISRTLTMYRLVEGSVSATSFRTNRDIREIYVLISKFDNVLSKKDISCMYWLICKISSRRMMKWIFKKEPALWYMNFKQFCKSTMELIIFNFKPGHSEK